MLQPLICCFVGILLDWPKLSNLQKKNNNNIWKVWRTHVISHCEWIVRRMLAFHSFYRVFPHSFEPNNSNLVWLGREHLCKSLFFSSNLIYLCFRVIFCWRKASTFLRRVPADQSTFFYSHCVYYMADGCLDNIVRKPSFSFHLSLCWSVI